MRAITLLIIVFSLFTTVVNAQSISPSVEVFPDYTYDMSDGKKDFNAFGIKRAYFGVSGSFMEPEEEGLKLNYKVTFDIKEFKDFSSVSVKDTGEVVSKDGSANGYYIGFLKYAFLEIKDPFVKGLKLTLGQQNVPWVSFDEHMSKMRWWGSVFSDRVKKLSSTDRGISLFYSFPAKYGEIHFAVVNGEGYHSPELSKDKDIMVRVSLRPLPEMDYLKGIMLHGYYGYGRTNEDKSNLDSEGIRKREILAISYDFQYLTFMAQYLRALDGLDTDAVKPVESSGYSVWAKIKLEKLLSIENEVGIWARYDAFDDGKKEESDKHIFYTVGPYYYLAKEKVALGLDYNAKIYDDSAKKDETYLMLHGLIKY